MVDIHNYKRRLENTLKRINESNLSERNKKTVLKFHDYCITQGLSPSKLERYVYDLFRFAQMQPKLDRATKEDLVKSVVKIEKKDWSIHTKHTFKVMMRKFYKFADGIEEKGVYPERVRWIKPNASSARHKLPEELMNEEEVEKMIKFSKKARNRAFIAMLFESGCRIGEVGSIRIRDITFDEYGALINVSGKTGSRRIRLINSIPYLQEWLNQHPTNDDSGSYVWINERTHQTLSYGRFCYILRFAAKKAGIKKRIYPHLFRHSRATILANHLTEAQMKSYLGWTQSSKMAAVYVHLSGRDTDNAILKMNGMEIAESKKPSEKLRARSCQRCQTRNEATNKFCKLCGFVLDEEESQRIIRKEAENKEFEALMGKLLKNKDVIEILAKKLKEERPYKSEKGTYIQEVAD